MSTSIIPPNIIKNKLAEGRPVVGTMLVEIRQPSIMKILANAGMDFVIIDCEHGPFTFESVSELSQSAKLNDITPIVRTPDYSYENITRYLDSGAQGIMAPRVTCAREVEEILQYMKYPPQGRRGAVLGRAHTEFKTGTLSDMLKKMNEEIVLIVQIETWEALDNVEEILDVSGVDIAFVGPTDLSIALGVPGDMTHPKLQSAIERVIRSCGRRGVYPAIQMNNTEQGMVWAEKGMKIISLYSEVALLMKAGEEVTASVRSAFQPVSPSSP